MNACDALGPDITALARGELPPAEEAPVRVHLASCPACAALVEDIGRIRAAAAARPSPAPGAASRARLLAALDAALEASLAEEAARGPVSRLLDAGARRYAESRGFRFLTWSVAVHAAAALFLAARLSVAPGEGVREDRPSIEVSQAIDLPPVYEGDPLRPPVPVPPGGAEGRIELPFEGSADWAVVPRFGGADLGPPLPDPEDLRASLRLYPGEEFRAFATGRFRPELRARRLEQVYGAVEASRVRQAVERGVRWLAAVQGPDGTWPSGSPGDPAARRDQFRGGVTGVSLLALLGDGWTMRRPGAYAPAVREAVTALARSQDASGLLGGFARGAANDRPLCNHGPALAALAEAYGVDYGYLDTKIRDELKAVLGRAVKAALDAQLADGSFGYAPGARSGDSSVTLLLLGALEAARRAGIEVDPRAVERAGEYLLARLGSDGRLGYREAGDRSGDATLTAEALSLGPALRLPAEVRARMLQSVLDEARTGPAAGRVLFRSSLLEVLAAGGGGMAREIAPDVARAALEAQTASGAFPAAQDRYARAAGDALSTARTLRALTAPYRVAAP